MYSQEMAALHCLRSMLWLGCRRGTLQVCVREKGACPSSSEALTGTIYFFGWATQEV